MKILFITGGINTNSLLNTFKINVMKFGAKEHIKYLKQFKPSIMKARKYHIGLINDT